MTSSDVSPSLFFGARMASGGEALVPEWDVVVYASGSHGGHALRQAFASQRAVAEVTSASGGQAALVVSPWPEIKDLTARPPIRVVAAGPYEALDTALGL